MRSIYLGTIFLVCAILAAGPGSAQEQKKARLRPTGVRAVAGMVVPENADNALGLGGTINLGTVFIHWLHLSVGATHWSSDIDRSKFASNTSGSIKDVRVYTDLGIEPFEISGVGPYLDVGLALHMVDATIPNDLSLQDALTGTNVGAEVAFGIASSAGFFRLSAEARREFVDDVGNWSFVIGIGTRWDKRKAKKADERQSTNVPVVAPEVAQPAPQSTLDTKLEQLLVENRAMRDQIAALELQLLQQHDRATQTEIARLERQQDEMRRSLEELRIVSANAGSLKQTREGLLLSLRSSVLFASGNSTLQPGAAGELDRLAAIITKFAGAVVIVEGHTDSSGDAANNLQLSQGRADAVARELRRAGIADVRAIGFGADQPVGDNTTGEGRALNRRVEIRVLPQIATASDTEKP